MPRLPITALLAAAVLSTSLATRADAQHLGPQRQLLAIEPFYQHTRLDIADGVSREGVNAYGGRLWINLDPFHFIRNSSIALYASRSPSTTEFQSSVTTFGAEYDQFLVRAAARQARGSVPVGGDRGNALSP